MTQAEGRAVTVSSALGSVPRSPGPRLGPVMVVLARMSESARAGSATGISDPCRQLSLGIWEGCLNMGKLSDKDIPWEYM